MEIKTSINSGVGELAVSGRLDTVTAPQLEAEIKKAIEKDGCGKLVLDFSDLEYVSSAGLRVVLTAQKIMGRKGGVVVRNLNEVVREIFDMTGFSDMLTIE